MTITSRNFSIKFVFFLLFFLLSFFSETQARIPTQLIRSGVGINYLKYEEPGLMELSGFLYEARINLRQISDDYLFELAGNIQVGSLDYDGQTWGGTPAKTESDDLILNVAIYRGRYYTRRDHSGENYVFAGLAARYWFNDLKSTSDASGYRRQISYLYLPLGTEFSNILANDWQCIIRLEYRLFLQGRVKSHLTDAGFQDNAQNKQTSGSGLRAEIKWKNPQDERDSYDIGFALDYWNIENSNTDTVRDDSGDPVTVYEPANNTLTLSAFANFYF